MAATAQAQAEATKSRGLVQADGIQIETGPVGGVRCVGRVGHVTIARSIANLVHMSLMLSIPYPEFSWTEFSKAE
jgi:hypothetical protein